MAGSTWPASSVPIARWSDHGTCVGFSIPFTSSSRTKNARRAGWYAGARTVRSRALLPLLLATAFLASPPAAVAQEVRAENSNLLHFAFASQAGSGVYDVNGRSVVIYRIPISVGLPAVDEASWGWKLTLPVTFGFLDLKPSDFVDAEVRDQVSTVSFVPGLRFEVPVRSNWSLAPFAEGGKAWDLSGGSETWVYSAGIESTLSFPWHELEGRLGNRLMWAGITGDGRVLADDYSEFETGIELTQPLWFSIHGRPVDAGVFAVSYLYFQSLDAFRQAGELEMKAQWEIGVTFGTRPPFAYWKVRMPRIGLSYRFGDGISAARLVLSAPF